MIKELGAVVLTLGVLNAQDVNVSGWLEGSLGIEQGSNLRAYPTVQFGEKGLKYNSLVDFNDFYAFGKHDVSHGKLAANVGPVTVKPVAVYNQVPGEDYPSAGVNVSYGLKNGFGFVEPNFSKGRDPTIYTYHSKKFFDKLTLGVFTAIPAKSPKSTYVEVEANSNEIGNSGVNFYLRGNGAKGVPLTGQVGISVNPKKTWQKIKERKDRK